MDPKKLISPKEIGKAILNSPVEFALQILGDRCTLLILKNIWLGQRKFEDFIKEQDLQNTINKVDRNKIPTENYRRFAKALITDGNKNFFIQKPKLDLDLIALNSPFELNNNIFKFQLFEKNKPLGNWQITIFSKDEKSSYKEKIKTNLNGEGEISVIENRTYLLSAVKLNKVNYLQKIKYKSDWFSLWASLVFKK